MLIIDHAFLSLAVKPELGMIMLASYTVTIVGLALTFVGCLLWGNEK